MDSTPVSLLERLRRQAQPQDWERFVDLYTPFLLYWMRRLGASRQEAEDLVQDVLTSLVKKLPDFHYQPSKSFRGWLRTIVIHRWSDHVKRPHRMAALKEADVAAVAGKGEMEEEWEREHRQWLIRRAMELMRQDFQPATWKACWAHVAEGRPAAVVARELGITDNAVFVATSRVLRRLREELAGFLD